MKLKRNKDQKEVNINYLFILTTRKLRSDLEIPIESSKIQIKSNTRPHLIHLTLSALAYRPHLINCLPLCVRVEGSIFERIWISIMLLVASNQLPFLCNVLHQLICQWPWPRVGAARCRLFSPSVSLSLSLYPSLLQPRAKVHIGIPWPR